MLGLEHGEAEMINLYFAIGVDPVRRIPCFLAVDRDVAACSQHAQERAPIPREGYTPVEKWTIVSAADRAKFESELRFWLCDEVEMVGADATRFVQCAFAGIADLLARCMLRGFGITPPTSPTSTQSPSPPPQSP